MTPDLICFSHLRWDFVFQRPNHLMARAAKSRRVFFVEEPAIWDRQVPGLRMRHRDGVAVITPQLPAGLPVAARTRALRGLIDRAVKELGVVQPVLWYYTPMALPWSRHLEHSKVVYDCMDHLAGFRGAPPELLTLETELLVSADVVFSGGASLHERVRRRHHDAHCFPSSVDEAHFQRARRSMDAPPDQASIPAPRIGYAGVIDERLDLDLIRGVAAARPDWQFVLLGPVAKIDSAEVPRAANIHALGLKPYEALPSYLGGWDLGWMPFARNESTRYISPTKTPEYLAAGLPVVSTSIRDVIEPYGRRGLVGIADTVADTVAAMGRALAGDRPAREEVDAFLASSSWDRTWDAMERHLTEPSSVPSGHADLASTPGPRPIALETV